MDQDVGREVKRLREERGWSQARLAVGAEMSVSGVSMIENGRRNLTTTTLAKLAAALGVEVADLFPKAQTPLPFKEETEQRRSPFMEAWTAYLLRRTQDLEDALPERARAFRPAMDGSVPSKELQRLTEELSAEPDLALKLLLRSEMLQSEFDATSLAIIEAQQLAKRIGAPEMKFAPGTRRFVRADFLTFMDAAVRMLDVAAKWAAAGEAAKAVSDTSESPENFARADEAIERAVKARQNVVALFEGRRSA